ncbi:MAG: galactose-1-phosphate uridylyltransferase [Anaerolineae bacterium]|nr:galactose-1-phosphate uridylyltransferase [Anaerolineae bacterium]
MPELRRDPIAGRWVAIATERARRPESFRAYPRSESEEAEAVRCPFCPADGPETEPELLAYRPPGGQPNDNTWTLRVLANKYPAFMMNDTTPLSRRGIYESTSGRGAHEVIIYTRHHNHDLALTAPEEAIDLVRAMRDRMYEHVRHPRIEYVSIFCNHGREAGASLRHPHCQVLAVPVLPNQIVDELREAGYYHDTRAQCLFCAMLKQELDELTRIVWQNDAFVAFCPWASHAPFETWIMPRRHVARFENILHDEIPQLGAALREVLARLYFGLDDPPFNFFVHTAPSRRDVSRYYHWHLEIHPRLAQPAGFELSTGVTINTMAPEQAAAYLRSVWPDIPEAPMDVVPEPVFR